MQRRGYQTSEFWFTLVSFIMSGLFIFGVISEPDTRDELTDTFTHVVESIILLGGQAFVLGRYIKKRKEEKIEQEKTRQKEQENLHKELEDYVGIDKTYTKININKATLGELIQLPHIGPSLAKKIVEYREENGKFKSMKSITKVSGIGDSIYKDIKPHITTRG